MTELWRVPLFEGGGEIPKATQQRTLGVNLSRSKRHSYTIKYLNDLLFTAHIRLKVAFMRSHFSAP